MIREETYPIISIGTETVKEYSDEQILASITKGFTSNGLRIIGFSENGDFIDVLDSRGTSFRYYIKRPK